MLVLSRKLLESLVINGNVTVTVVDIRGLDGRKINKKSVKVRLGIEAPSDVTVHRLEVQELIDAQRPAPETITRPGDNVR